jgi:hypothetical protein
MFFTVFSHFSFFTKISFPEIASHRRDGQGEVGDRHVEAAGEGRDDAGAGGESPERSTKSSSRNGNFARQNQQAIGHARQIEGRSFLLSFGLSAFFVFLTFSSQITNYLSHNP